MQPLDVSLFQLCKHWHSLAINNATRTGCQNFNKLEFWESLGSIFKKAFKDKCKEGSTVDRWGLHVLGGGLGRLETAGDMCTTTR